VPSQAKFSHKSDVFALGVLLWELLSFGKTPWGAFGIADMTDALRAGERLQRPGMVPAEVDGKLYAIALRCWHDRPEKRPSFRELHDKLSVLSAVMSSIERSAGAAAAPVASGHHVASANSGNIGPGTPTAPSLSSATGYEYDAAAPVPPAQLSMLTSLLPTRASPAPPAGGAMGYCEPTLDPNGYVAPPCPPSSGSDAGADRDHEGGYALFLGAFDEDGARIADSAL